MNFAHKLRHPIKGAGAWGVIQKMTLDNKEGVGVREGPTKDIICVQRLTLRNIYENKLNIKFILTFKSQ